jgi:hypothetical protein
MVNEQNPIRAMLDGWDEAHWVQGTVATIHGPQRVCLLGRYLQTMRLPFDTLIDTLDWRDLHRIGATTTLAPAVKVIYEAIRAQFPERAADMLPGQNVPLFAVSEIIGFNDHYETSWTDIELVLGKAAVMWDEVYA